MADPDPLQSAAVDEFLGLLGFTPPVAGGEVQWPLRLAFEHRGRLYLDRQSTGLLMYLAAPMADDGLPHWRLALDLCHPRHRHPYDVRAGLHTGPEGDELVFGLLLPSGVRATDLTQGLDLLTRLHARMRDGA